MKKSVRAWIVIGVCTLCFAGCQKKENKDVYIADNNLEQSVTDTKELSSCEYHVSNEKVSIKFSIGDIETDSGMVKVNGFQLNKNCLPYIKYVIALPKDTDIEDVEIVLGEQAIKRLGGQVKQECSYEVSTEEQVNTFFVSKSDCQVNVWIESKYGVKIAHVYVYPFSLDGSLMKFASEGEINIQLVDSNWNIESIKNSHKKKLCKIIDNEEILDSY